MTAYRNRTTTFALEGGLSASMTIGIGVVLAIEGAAIHLWVAPRSQAWAWAITAVNVATLIWLWRDYRAASHASMTVSDSQIEISIGRRIQCVVPRQVIERADVATWRSVPDMAGDYLNTAKPLESNVLLVLREPVKARLSLGLHKQVTRIGLKVPDADSTLTALRAAAAAGTLTPPVTAASRIRC